MSVHTGQGTASQPMTSKIWRWKGTPSDIVRIGETVSRAAGGPLVIEVTDAMGTRNFTSTAELERALSQPFLSLALQAVGSECKVTAVFDATGVHSPAAVTVVASGSDPPRAAAACGTVTGAASAGAREPKGTPPAEIEKWAGVGSLASIAGPAIGLLAGESDPGLLLLLFVVTIFGLVCVFFYIGYETLIPRVELLAAGATPRIHKAALWLGGAIGATLVGAVVSGLL